MFQWNKRTAEGVNKSSEYFRQAIQRDPQYAMAYVGLANSYIVGESRDTESAEVNRQAKEYALKALEIDPTLGEPHAALGNIAFYYDWDWPRAETEYKRAIELSPNYATAHHWYGEGLAAMGRFEESLAEYDKALEIEPLSLAIATDKGRAYHLARQYDKAIEYFRSLIELDPEYGRTYMYLAWVYEDKEMFDEALKARYKRRMLDHADLAKVAANQERVRKAVAESGKRGYWETMLELAAKDKETDHAPIYSYLNQRDKAFEGLEKMYQNRTTSMVFLRVDPCWDNIRSDPRFADLLRRMDAPRNN
jgi:tetratricopeptide (TPR) repeat protein